MAVYVFEAKNGEQIERDFPIGTAPQKIGRFKRIIVGVGLCVPKEHQAVTYAGREGQKILARQYRQNKAVAEGLANGTMNPPEGRDVVGDMQPREFKAQFNDMYESAKQNA